MKTPQNQVIPAVILLFCLWSLANIFKQLTDVYSLLSIAVGVTGVALYYKSHPAYDTLFYAWVFMQVPNITYHEANVISSFPLSFGLGMTLGLRGGGDLGIYFNALPIGLYYLVKYFNVEKSLGYNIRMNRLRRGSFPQIEFPVSGNIEKIAGRDKLTAIYVVRLNNGIMIKDKTYHYVLLEPKNTTLILVPYPHQICGLRLCTNPELAFSEKQNPFVDWVTAETKKVPLEK
ncbi:MAG: hypothetical protein O9353_11220 [Bacteroidia bacterium]|nr:hypothetical protein [Bacteroidia bacterium]